MGAVKKKKRAANAKPQNEDQTALPRPSGALRRALKQARRAAQAGAPESAISLLSRRAAIAHHTFGHLASTLAAQGTFLQVDEFAQFAARLLGRDRYRDFCKLVERLTIQEWLDVLVVAGVAPHGAAHIAMTVPPQDRLTTLLIYEANQLRAHASQSINAAYGLTKGTILKG